MRLRQTGQQQFPSQDCRFPFPLAELTYADSRAVAGFLYAFGDDDSPLPETIRVLDEIIVDFIIETCHEAALCASYSRRSKIKVDDFKFMLRKDPKKLGRVTELLSLDKEIKKKRKMTEIDEVQMAREQAEKDGRKGKKAKAGKGGEEEE